MTDHISDANKKVQPATPLLDALEVGNPFAQPAPAPLPGDDGVMCARLLFACTGHPHALIPWPHRLLHDAVAHISDLTRRLAEAEAENGRFAGMLEDSISGWRKLYTEERAERVQAERQESDEHINGLNVVIKTQDKAIRDLKSRVVELENDLGAAVEQKVRAIFNLGRCKALLNAANLKLERLRNV